MDTVPDEATKGCLDVLPHHDQYGLNQGGLWLSLPLGFVFAANETNFLPNKFLAAKFLAFPGAQGHHYPPTHLPPSQPSLEDYAAESSSECIDESLITFTFRYLIHSLCYFQSQEPVRTKMPPTECMHTYKELTNRISAAEKLAPKNAYKYKYKYRNSLPFLRDGQVRPQISGFL